MPPAPTRGPTSGGRTIPRSRRLESRLLVSHLVLLAVPSLLLTAVGTVVVRAVLSDLQSPTIERAYERSATLAHEVQDRLRVEGERLLSELPTATPAPEEEVWIRERLADRGFDFAAWDDESARVVELGDTDPDAFPTREEWDRLADGTVPTSRRGGALRFFHPDGRAVGVFLDPEALTAIDTVGDDYSRYRQLLRVEAVKKNLLAALLAAVFLVSAGVAFWVARQTARRISRPVTLLAAAADRLAAGDLSHRAVVNAEGEIGELVDAFNRMGGQLERSRDELVRMERVAAWRDVARRVAHEIRNPLTPIRLAVHRLRPRLPDDAGTRECLDSIGEEIENLTRISETFSEFARMPDAQYAPVDLVHVVQGVAELYRDTVEGVALEVDAPTMLRMVGDRDLLRRALGNLIKNAGEALAETGGTIRVVVRGDGRFGRVEVLDDGPGVPEEIRATLFRPGVSGRAGGSGLGLAMVQRIAMDHRGALEWESGDPGSVFRFTVRLDLQEDP
jgi:nitrogen fixation/metabolism regulation signal transduction histidine kinase